jgi:hypothetical protein
VHVMVCTLVEIGVVQMSTANSDVHMACDVYFCDILASSGKASLHAALYIDRHAPVRSIP